MLTAFAAARRGGSVVLIGLPPHGETAAVAVDDLVNNDLTIRAASATPRAPGATWSRCSTRAGSGLGFLVTHRFGLADWETALAALRGSESPRGKVMLPIGRLHAGKDYDRHEGSSTVTEARNMTFTSRNPHDPSDVIGEWQAASEAEVAARSAGRPPRAPGGAGHPAAARAAGAVRRGRRAGAAGPTR